MTERSLIVKVLQSHVHYQVVPDSTEDYEKGMYVLISVRHDIHCQNEYQLAPSRPTCTCISVLNVIQVVLLSYQ